MKMIGFVGILVLGLISSGFCQDVTNREILEKLNSLEVRMVRLETKVEEGQKSLQKQIDGLQGQINGLQNMIMGVLAGIFALIAFVLWDRRTALAP